MTTQINIEPYTSLWAKNYELEKASLEQALDSRFKGIEHIGSTAVLGLGAKPIIDMMIGVTKLEDADQFIHPLSRLGYEHVVHNHFPNRRFFRKGAWGAGTHHLHVYVYKSVEWNNQLLFRDYLIEHEEARHSYYCLKLELAKQYAHDRTSYTASKTDFIEAILKKAKSVQ